MKKALLILSLAALGGCSSTEIITGTNNSYSGYKSYDPCIRCGEGWTIMPNEDLYALKAYKRMQKEAANESENR
jgi:hypothetical protein